MNSNFRVIEAMMYIQGEIGLMPRHLKEVLSIPTLNARKLLQEFRTWYNEQERGLMVMEFSDNYKMATREEFKEDITKLVAVEKKQRLSGAAIETAGIIAYKQPITKSQINEVRGVSSEAVVNTLLVKGIIEEKGIAKTIGNPVLYGISDKFYDYFKIQSLKELPMLSELDESEGLEGDFDLYTSQRAND